MKTFLTTIRIFLPRRLMVAAFVLTCVPAALPAADRQQAPVNKAGAPVLDAKGRGINYSRESLTAMGHNIAATRVDVAAGAAPVAAPQGFVPAPTGAPRPFWQYAIFGSGIGASNIVIGPAPSGGGAPEILIGGNSTNNFGANDFWQAIRRNPTTGNYDAVFVSPIYTAGGYSAAINRIGISNVVGDSNQEIVVMLEDGRIYLYDFATKAELGYINTGIIGLEGLSLTDLNGNGYAELIVTTMNDLFVFNGAGNLLWKKAGAGGYDVVAGRWTTTRRSKSRRPTARWWMPARTTSSGRAMAASESG